MSERDQFSQLMKNLKTQRDELALQIHLGKAEAKEEWEKVCEKLDDLTSDYEPLKDAVDDTAANVFDAMKLVAGEIEEGFQRIRKTF